MDDYFEEAEKKAVEKAIKATRKEEQENFVMKLIQLGTVSLKDIATCTGLTLRRVQTLAKRYKNQNLVTP